MNFIEFIKGKLFFLVLQSLMILFVGGLLNFYQVDVGINIMVCVSLFLVCLLSFVWEYWERRAFYQDINQKLNSLTKKHYLSTMLETPNFVEGKILCEVLEETSKSLNDEISIFRRQNEEYRDYIEVWVHEIKLPIACVDLICENNKNEQTSSIKDELIRIDNFVEQALYYARCSAVEKDYIIKSASLDSLVKSTLKKHSKQLIGAKAKINLSLSDKTVYCDPKWLDFILGQILSNSIKYRKDDFSLQFTQEENKECIVLTITDSGIGIPAADLERVCEKGFTGKNGRLIQKSTGMGLYLCKKLCDKMYLGFEVESKENEYTAVKIVFPKDSRMLLA